MTAAATGERLAHLLSGSWRHRVEPLSLTAAHLAALLPLLLRHGVAGLAWRRIEASAEADPELRAAAAPLRRARLSNAWTAAAAEERLARAAGALSAAGVEPLLGKGWALVRSYPHPGLRPPGDIDLYVPESRHAEARRALAAAEVAGVDLHAGFAELAGRTPEQIYGAARAVPAAGGEVLAFGAEDHLRLVALHALRHGVGRALWLCDLALLAEGRAAGFDWEALRQGDRRQGHWVGCALRLAHELLGMSLAGVELPEAGRPLPAWVPRTVLGVWGRADYVVHGARRPLSELLGQPRAWPRALRQRWPGGVEATVGLGRAFDDLPRLPLQVAECLRRSVAFVGHLSRTVRQTH